MSFLRHFPSGRPAPPLAGILPSGARTFLPDESERPPSALASLRAFYHRERCACILFPASFRFLRRGGIPMNSRRMRREPLDSRFCGNDGRWVYGLWVTRGDKSRWPYELVLWAAGAARILPLWE